MKSLHRLKNCNSHKKQAPQMLISYCYTEPAPARLGILPAAGRGSQNIPFFPGFRRCAPASRSACGGAVQKRYREKSSSGLDFFLCISFAERTGFEPVSRFRRLHAFQACLFSHSSIFPLCLQRYAFSGNYNIRPLNLKSDLPIKKACHTSTPVIR